MRTTCPHHYAVVPDQFITRLMPNLLNYYIAVHFFVVCYCWQRSSLLCTSVTRDYQQKYVSAVSCKTVSQVTGCCQNVISNFNLQFWSTPNRICIIPCTHNSFGEFSAAGLRVWNALPSNLTRPELQTFQENTERT